MPVGMNAARVAAMCALAALAGCGGLDGIRLPAKYGYDWPEEDSLNDAVWADCGRSRWLADRVAIASGQLIQSRSSTLRPMRN